MRKFGLLGTSALRSAVFASAAAVAFASPAYAQPAQAGDDEGVTEAEQPEALGQNEVELEAGQDATTSQTLTVTGSRIRSPNLTSTVPITSIGIQDLTATGDVSLGDTLNELPALRSTFSQANSTRFIGTAGLNLLDLRGLGNARTLVLVNGRRHVTAQPGNNNVDVNTIPTDLVERVDIVTGGNSAIYGSDAVAGVVNFILRRDFEGIRIRGQGGVSDRGDRGSYFTSVTAGTNFADDRGNVAVAFEYARQTPLFFTERDGQTGAYSGRNQFNAVQNTGPQLNPSAGAIRTGGEPGTGDGIPDTAFLRGVRNNNISEGGLLTAACPTAAATGESTAAFNARRAAACSGLPNPSSSNALAQFGRTFLFLDDGSLIANPCTTDLRPFGSSNCVGGLGSTLRLTGMLQAGLERYAANFLGSFEFSPAFRPFVEAKYVRVDALQEGQPTFFNNTFNINNPFLTDQARATLQTILAPGATTFTAQRFNVDFGGRGEEHRRETYRVVAGVTGEFNDDWSYEVSFNYGHLDTFYRTNGNVLVAEYGRAINAVRNSAGTIVCAVNADASTTNDDPNCVPVNLFGNGQVSQAALDYFGIDSTRDQTADQYNALAFVSGDLSQLFELPGGPVGFVLGAEYRREEAFSAFDPITQSGATFLNIIPTFDPPAYEIYEAFAELNVPILRNVPFAEELSLQAAGRVSDYNLGSTGTVFAYNVGGTYAPVRDLRIRAGYAKSVRAPTLTDLFSSPSQTFLNGLVDPCGQQNINNNPNRVANCAAAGVPTTQTFNGITEPFTNRPASGISGFNRGNPILNEEKGESITIGAVFQPRFIPGLSLTVDYYNIKIDNVIFSLAPQTIINQCYDNPSGIDNPFCAVVFRNPNGTFQGQQNVINAGETVSFPITGPSFFSQPFNFAKQETSGIDFDLAYRTSIGPNATLNLRGILSHTFERNNFTDITDPTFRNRQLSELGDPRWAGQATATLDLGMFDFQYQFRFIGSTVIALEFEDQNPFDGRPARNPDAFPQVFYPDVYYHDFRIGFEPVERFRFYVGVDNAFDRLPPLDLLGTAGGDPYDNVGRFFYAGAEVKF
jgi:outer membrane receptor protein involved in Fe transport